MVRITDIGPSSPREDGGGAGIVGVDAGNCSSTGVFQSAASVLAGGSNVSSACGFRLDATMTV